MVLMPKGRRRRQELYDTAARLFAAQGYHGTSLRDLARELGMQKSSLYHYFESKQDLLFHLLDAYISEALVEIEAMCAQPVSPKEKLARFMRFYTDRYAGDLDRLTLLVNEVPNLEPQRRAIMEEKERRYVAALGDILSDLQKDGLMKDMPLAVAAFAFFGMVHFTYKWYRPQGPVKPAELADYFLEIFSSGILKPDAEDNTS